MIRSIVKSAIIGKITQGTIFSGAISEYYPNCLVWGLVVSARCDIAQKKNLSYFYLPVIRWEDWHEVELPLLLIDNLKHDKEELLRKELSQLNLSPSIVGRFPLEKIENIINNQNVSSKQKNKLKACISALKDVEIYNRGDMTTKELFGKYSGERKSQIDLLLKNGNPNFYFFEIEDSAWYIIRMKELHRLTRDVFFKLADGIDSPICNYDLNDLRKFEEEDLYMPLYEIQSPYIEHIMQQFVNQFSKIGVEDLSDSLKTKIQNSI